jgi:hypothetical protein
MLDNLYSSSTTIKTNEENSGRRDIKRACGDEKCVQDFSRKSRKEETTWETSKKRRFNWLRFGSSKTGDFLDSL